MGIDACFKFQVSGFRLKRNRNQGPWKPRRFLWFIHKWESETPLLLAGQGYLKVETWNLKLLFR
jgi:hypothetical protein